MQIVRGRGNRRQVIELPQGETVQSFAKSDNKAYLASLRTICELVGVPVPKWLDGPTQGV